MISRLKSMLLALSAAWLLILPVSVESQIPALPECQQQQICRDLRFRKLHLVRPDLIRYPIVVEVFC